MTAKGEQIGRGRQRSWASHWGAGGPVHPVTGSVAEVPAGGTACVTDQIRLSVPWNQCL